MFGFGGNKRKKAEDINAEGLKFAQSNNDFEKALKKFLEAIKADPTFHDAYGNAGNCYRYTNQPQKAIEYYTKALEVKPDFDETYYNRGIVYKTIGQLDLAIADYETLLKSGGAKRLNMEQGINEDLVVLRTMLIIRDLKKDTSSLPASKPMSSDVEALFTQGTDLFKQRQYPAVIDISSRAIDRDSGQLELYNLRGAACLASGYLEKAAPDIYRALRINPEHVPALGNRASLLKRIELYDDALADLNKLIALKPGDVHFLSERADVYQKLKKLDEALRDWDTVVKINPQDVNAQFYRAVTFNQMRKYPEAIEGYSITLQLNNMFAEAYPARALAYAAVGKFKEGVADLETYIQQGARGRMTLDQAKSYISAMRKSGNL